MTRIRTISKTLLLAAVLFGGLITRPAAAQPQEIPLGSQMPEAALGLLGTDGRQQSLASLQGRAGTAVVFWSNQCPWVGKYRDRVLASVEAYRQRGIAFVFVNSNDAAAFPKESLEANREENLPGAYLSDPASTLALAFGATRAPQVFLFDADETLVYVGSFDDSPGDPGNVSKRYLHDAVEATLAGQAVAVPKTKAFGCMLKYAQ